MTTDYDRKWAREFAQLFGGNGLTTERQIELVADEVAKLREIDMGRPVASGIEAAVCADIARRQAHGLAKYGQTVADNPLPLRAWLTHAYEESLDQAIYLRRAMAEIDGGAK